ncbi:hypothetical protein BH09MYX1_BH09MYX1_41630 [soil metagenome]
MLNLAATTSLCAAALGFLFTALTLVVSASPGLRSVRIFSVSCLCGALYGICTALMALSSSPEVGVLSMRFGLMLAGFHAAAWFVYRIRREQRAMTRLERAVLVALVVVALAALIPGAYTGAPWRHEVPLVGVVYQDAHATWLASAAMTFDWLVVVWMFVRAVHLRRSGSPTHGAEIIGLGALLASAAHDSLVSMDLLPTPYMLDLGYVVLVVAMAFALTRHFVNRSIALEASSQELAATQKELVARERLVALGEMSAVVAHEVRNPLGVIFNALASLKKRPGGSEEQRQLLRIVEEEAERLKRMVSDLLHFAQSRHLTAVDTSIEPLVTSAVDAARASTGAADEEVEIEVASALAIRCDEHLMRQAIVNLVTNALQAAGRRGPVRVHVHVVGDTAIVAVANEGQGVAPELATDVFRPFFTTRATGTGLGLSVVRKIVEAHGGTVELSETTGGGATFSLHLPHRSRVREEAA